MNAQQSENKAGNAQGLRIGHGYDLHRLEPKPPAGAGRAFVLAGVELEHGMGPIGHSDADALFHAVTDALLGALGMEDIGQLFPDDKAENESRDSAEFVREAARRVRGAGWDVVNIDCTVILERPRIGPKKDEMRGSIARALGVDPGRVNVKGKSHEQVDAVGEGRAVEVHAVVLLEGRSG
jgi:2-C-methyl-D-erythritol 2,4-cyclodiphosphate synthase